ncbi:MAG: T9SS type A sorting domain-containing protein [Candidatus Cloacimonetes bacterium]|nr:T9SS type A sorting domain-containing protein [Candidatus Cloacimonadota bacterium]MCK9184092.1 T9SS type A sorting domain-containing protein [Candidatus Cloacimonadota bacterium]
MNAVVCKSGFYLGSTGVGFGDGTSSSGESGWLTDRANENDDGHGMLYYHGEGYSGHDYQVLQYTAPIDTFANVSSNHLYRRSGTKWIGGEYLYLYNEEGLPVCNAEELIPEAMSTMNYPNPFKESTAIRFEKTTDGPLQINIYNLKGQKLRTYSIAALPKGEREIVWDGKDNRGQNCASGLYLIQIQDREGSRIHKAVKLK